MEILFEMDAADLMIDTHKFFHQASVPPFFRKDARTIRWWERGEIPIPGAYSLLLEALLSGAPTKHELRVAEDGEDPKFSFVDLFAGIGGTRLGFQRAGGDCIFTSEWDRFACLTYRSNFSDQHEIAGDIRQIDERDVPDHDVLVAGFPCQPFSLAGVSKKNSLGRLHGFLDKTQGTLFFEIARILKAKQPKAFVLENVKNLVGHDRGRTFEVILRTLNELGYATSHKILNARHWVPQHRERIFIVGFRSGLSFSWELVNIPLASYLPRLGQVLHDSSEPAEPPYTESLGNGTQVSSRYTLSDKLWKYLQTYAQRHKEKGNGFGCSVFSEGDVARTLSARYHKDGSEILIKQGRSNPRRLTPRECARLMGFPDDFKIPVSDTQAYRQFGNSVVVPVVEAVAKAVASRLGSSLVTADAPGQLEFSQLRNSAFYRPAA